MAKYKCVKCGNVIEKPDKNNPPDLCVNPDCGGYIFIEISEQDEPLASYASAEAVILTYLKTGEEINISFFPVILGVENIGWEILQKVKNSKGQNVISRKHCEIVCSENNLFVRDLNSTNGTFVEIDGNSRRVGLDIVSLEKVNYLVLGQERFTVMITDAVVSENTEIGKPLNNQSVDQSVKRFKCKVCGNIYDEKIVNCECGARKSIIEF